MLNRHYGRGRCALFSFGPQNPQEKAEPAYFYRGDFRSSANRDRLCIPPQRAALLQFAAAIASALVTLYLSQPAKPPIYGRLKKAWLKLNVVRTSSRGFLVQKRPIWMSTLGGTSGSGQLDFFTLTSNDRNGGVALRIGHTISLSLSGRFQLGI